MCGSYQKWLCNGWGFVYKNFEWILKFFFKQIQSSWVDYKTNRSKYLLIGGFSLVWQMKIFFGNLWDSFAYTQKRYKFLFESIFWWRYKHCQILLIFFLVLIRFCEGFIPIFRKVSGSLNFLISGATICDKIGQLRCHWLIAGKFSDLNFVTKSAFLVNFHWFFFKNEFFELSSSKTKRKLRKTIKFSHLQNQLF